MSAVRDGIRAASMAPSTRRPTPPTRVRRGGAIDLLLVAIVAILAGTRTPAGALTAWGIERLRGNEAELPTLTAWFEHGAAAPPAVDLVLPDAGPPVPDGGIPEPWRSAARAVLADPPERVGDAIAARHDLPEQDRAILALDQWYEDDAEAALELLALGPDLRARAIGRARAAGDADPERYETHRRYLPPSAARDADRVVTATLALASALEMAWPVADPKITSPFGWRTHPVLGDRRFHNGVDLSAVVGTEVTAPQDGTVAIIGEDATSGRFVVVDHGHGLRTAYCHLSEPLVARGSTIRRGQALARSGNTGRSTGPHLHWILRIAGKPVDPERFAPKVPLGGA